MQDRSCSKCGSHNMYKTVGRNWNQGGVVLQMLAEDNFPIRFETEAYLCLDCRFLEIQVLETSTIFGDQKSLAEVVPASSNWVKVQE